MRPFPTTTMTVLVDYFGREITDSLDVCRRFPELAAQGKLGVRLDTPGSRFIEGSIPRCPMRCWSAMCRR